MTKPGTNACRFLFFPLYWACIQRQTDTKSKSHLAGCVHYIFIRGGGASLGRRKRQQRLRTMLKTLPLPARKAPQSHVGLNGWMEGRKMWDGNSDGRQGGRTIAQGATASAVLGGRIYKKDGITRQKPPNRPNRRPPEGDRVSFQRDRGHRT